jgi:hypothetical protein
MFFFVRKQAFYEPFVPVDEDQKECYENTVVNYVANF